MRHPHAGSWKGSVLQHDESLCNYAEETEVWCLLLSPQSSLDQRGLTGLQLPYFLSSASSFGAVHATVKPWEYR